MGPTPFSVGYSQTGKPLHRRRLASMGPTPFSVGYQEGLRQRVSPCKLLQWGQRLSALDTTPASLPPTSRRQCFNGANAFQRWILTTRWSTSKRTSSFNGANAFQRWIRRGRVLRLPSRLGLQWGQRLSALDTGEITLTLSDLSSTSMGPTQGNRILSILAYLPQLNIAKIDNSLGNSEFIG